MCLELFISSDKPLPLIPWNDQLPAFHVVDLSDGEDVVRDHLKELFIYYAGSHEGCGCAFNYDSEFAEPDELMASEQSLNLLIEYLETSLSTGAGLKIFSCWAGEENKSPESFRTITPKEIHGLDFVFETPELITIQTGR